MCKGSENSIETKGNNSIRVLPFKAFLFHIFQYRSLRFDTPKFTKIIFLYALFSEFLWKFLFWLRSFYVSFFYCFMLKTSAVFISSGDVFFFGFGPGVTDFNGKIYWNDEREKKISERKIKVYDANESELARIESLKLEPKRWPDRPKKKKVTSFHCSP